MFIKPYFRCWGENFHHKHSSLLHFCHALGLKLAVILLLRRFWTLNLSSFKQRKGNNIYRLARPWHSDLSFVQVGQCPNFEGSFVYNKGHQKSRETTREIFLPAAILRVALSWPPPKATVFARLDRWQKQAWKHLLLQTKPKEEQGWWFLSQPLGNDDNCVGVGPGFF